MDHFLDHVRVCREQELFMEKFKWKRSDKGRWRESRNLYYVVRVQTGWELQDETGKKLGWGATLPAAQQEAVSHWFSSGTATYASVYNKRLKAVQARQIDKKLKESKEGRGVRDGTGPFKGSAEKGKGKRKKRGEKCPVEPPLEEGKDEVRELELYIENDYQLYRGQHMSIIKNLMKKRAAGKYDLLKAEKLFMYLVVAGAKKYAKDYPGGPPWNKFFSMEDRREVARSLRKSFESAASEGEYDEYIPKKYRK